jgi:shikimate kinase/3-dehydroquinate synthase
VILIGLSGTGKTSLAPLLAERLGFDAIDTDTMVEARFGCSIPEIFERFGEPVFRAAERQALLAACARDGVVIATGGGVVLDEANWVTMRPGSVIVHLQARPRTIVERLHCQWQSDPRRLRPLLQGDDPERRVEQLWHERAALYRRADLVVQTDGRSLELLAHELGEVVRAQARAGLVPVASIGGATGRSDIYVAPGLLRDLGSLTRARWPAARAAFVIGDAAVWVHWGRAVCEALETAEYEVHWTTVPPGERSKALAEVERLLEWLLDQRISRGDVVVAVGGGVTSDLVGLVASLVLRGVGLVQVPTSLLAMVDASVGGKTAVNHPRGKNLIGSFYQPHLVVADPEVLRTLPGEELRSGWAEVVKHAMIEVTATGHDPGVLLAQLEEARLEETAIDLVWLARVIRRNIEIKAAVVLADERETGLRRILNYGHTLGHAIEAAGFHYRHGEAIALGMRAVARMAASLGVTSWELVDRQDRLLDRLGLPRRFEGSVDEVLDRLAYDKKAVHGQLTWILPVRLGEVTVTRDVPWERVIWALETLRAGSEQTRIGG